MKAWFALAALFVLSVASAASLSINPSSLAACPCDPFYYKIYVQSDQADVFDMRFQPEKDFSYFIQPQVPVPANSVVETTLVLNTLCEAPVGNYSFSITAVGKKSSAIVEGSAIVKKCGSLELSVPPQQSVCAGSSQTVVVTLRNKGVFDESGKLSFSGLPSQFYYLADDSFDLKPGESRNFLLSLQPSASTPPASFEYSLFAGTAKAKAALDISSCSFTQPHKVGITALSSNVQVCSGAKKSISFSLKNEGQTTSVKLVSSGVAGQFPASVLTVPGSSSRNVSFTIDASKLAPGNQVLSVEIQGPSSSASTSVPVKVIDCPSAVFGDLQLCLGETGSIPFAFKNNNAQPQYYAFNASSSLPVHVEPATALIQSNGAASASVFITGSALGIYPVRVFANTTLLSTPKVIVIACEVPPGQLEITQDELTLEFGVLQKAVLTTNVALSQATVSLPSGLFEVTSSSTVAKDIVFTVKPLSQGDFLAPVFVNSTTGRVEKQVLFHITEPSVRVLEKTQTTASADNQTVDNEFIYSIKNNGLATVTLDPSSSISNAVFTPSQLQLDAGEEQELRMNANGLFDNQTVTLFLSTPDKTFSVESKAIRGQPSSTTGFFTASRTVGFFAIIVVAAIIVLAYVLKREFDDQKRLNDEYPDAGTKTVTKTTVKK